MKTLITGLLSVFLISSCADWKEKEVTITKDYVINPNWEEKRHNSFAVYKMKLKDSTKTIDLKDPAGTELYHGLIEDSSFSFTTNVEYNGEDYAKRKVYFNRYNDFSWGKLNDMHSDYEQKILGELQPETWYLLAGLSQFKTLYYIYLDTSDSLHVYKVSGMTNY
ncbi:MAG: hypothetical protein Q4G27_02800 [Flavobacteriaceae bacterium]|nr:hypothetical protein [Flavobacteriaceae bacterium]